MGAIQTMGNVVKLKRPVIFVCHLNKKQLLSLIKRSDDFINLYAGEYPTDMQVFVQTDGTVNLLFSYTVDREEEVLCSSYDDFISKWDQYRLSILL